MQEQLIPQLKMYLKQRRSEGRPNLITMGIGLMVRGDSKSSSHDAMGGRKPL